MTPKRAQDILNIDDYNPTTFNLERLSHPQMDRLKSSLEYKDTMAAIGLFSYTFWHNMDKHHLSILDPLVRIQ